MSRRALKNWLKDRMFGVHLALTRLGVFVLPAHYYVNVPNLLTLRAT